MKKITFFIVLLICVLIFCLTASASGNVSKFTWNAGTTSEGTSGYVAIGVMSEILNKYAGDFIWMTPIAYTGSVAGLRGYDKEETDSMYGSMQQIDMIQRGYGPFSPDTYKWSREFAQFIWMYEVEWYAIIRAKDKDKIKCWSDFTGKKVYPHTKGSSTYEFLKTALGPDGLNIWGTFEEKQFARSHAADALKLGEVDVIIGYNAAGSPAGWIQELVTRCNCIIVTPTPKEMGKILNSAKYVTSVKLDPSIFDKDIGLASVVDIPAVGYVYIVDPKIDEIYIYQAVKTIFEHAEEMAKSLTVWSKFAKDPLDYCMGYWKKGVEMGIPLSSGVLRYLRELGYDTKELALE